MLRKKCPCCGEKQTFFSFKGQRQMLPCESNQHYKCLHCDFCKNQIGKPIKVVIYHIRIIFLLLSSWIFAEYIREVFNIWKDYDIFFVNIPFMLLFFLAAEGISWYFKKLICVNVKDKKVFDTFDPLHIENDPKFTGVEQNTIKNTVNLVLIFQAILILFIIIGIIYSIFIE